MSQLRKQLLGLSVGSHVVGKVAQGRSGRVFPREYETPLRYLVADGSYTNSGWLRRIGYAINILRGR